LDLRAGEETRRRRELNKEKLRDWNGWKSYGEEIKKDEMDWACGMQREGNRCTQTFAGTGS